MNLNPGKTEFSDAEHDQLRREIERFKAQPPLGEGLSEAEIARQADISPSTLNSYLKGRYQGRNDPVAVDLFRWLAARRSAGELRGRLPIAPAFQPLATSQRILALIQYARAMGRMTVISGVPGVSKTATARQYCADHPRAYLATMEPATRGVPTMLLELLAAMGQHEARGTPQQLARKVITKVTEAQSVLLLDESQHLSDQAIEQLRAINDRCRVGIVLLGNEEAYSRIGPTGVKAAFAQVSSRIAQRRYIVHPAREDVVAMAHAWAAANSEEIGPREIEFLCQVAMKPGGLRNVEMTFEGALIAAHGGETPLTLEHLQGAFGSITDLTARAA